MTNAEINAAISGWFEPKPEPLDWVIIDQPIPSAKGFWLHTNSGYERGDVSVTIPLDYFTSEDANARLRDAMLKKMSFQEWADRMLLIDPTPIRGDGFEFKQKQVLAFLAFAGIAHKRDGGERA